MAAPSSIEFSDAAAYEQAMGRWSRAVASRFVDWLAPMSGKSWLDVGCGTGILAETVLDLCDPSSVTGVDSAEAQIRQAMSSISRQRASFRMADACQLPFVSGRFHYTVSALVMNFLSQPDRAVTEMRRVTISGGTVAAFVWDFTAELSPSGPLRQGMKALGYAVPPIPGTEQSRLDCLTELLAARGMEQVEARTFDVVLSYASFEEFWRAQTPSYTPTTKVIEALGRPDLLRLKRTVADGLAARPSGIIQYSVRANAVRGMVV